MARMPQVSARELVRFLKSQAVNSPEIRRKIQNRGN